MKVIYKYGLSSATRGVAMPAGAELLHAGAQHKAHDQYGLFVWARVDTCAPVVTRRLSVVGTGWDDRDGGDGCHVGTVQTPSGLVWHVFDHGEENL